VNCTNLMDSASPVCSKCGLPASAAGIIELAEIDQLNHSALSDAETLANFASTSFGIVFVTAIFGYFVPSWTVSFGFIAMVCLGIFWFKLFRWLREYSGNEFPDDVFTQAARLRNGSVVIALLAKLFLIALVFVRLI
jgi:hypothetical protein